ncbi:MAG: hypothetical protein ACYCS8_00585 [Acidithiobacillus sp.]
MKLKNMFHSKTKRQLARIQEVINTHSRGIYKRIDETRELMELLERDHGPGFLVRHPWVASWLESQDDFLDALRDADGLPVNKLGGLLESYPRPRPSYNLCHEKDDEAIPQISADEIRRRFEEIRTLIDALPRLTPDGFIRENRWIDGLLHWHGEFLNKVAAVFGVPLPQHQSDSHYYSSVQKDDNRRDTDIDSHGGISIHATSETNEQEDLIDRAKDLSCKIYFMIRSIATGGQCSAHAYSSRDIPDRERLHLIAVLADVGDNLPRVGTQPVWIERQNVENANSVTEFIATRQEVPDGFHRLTKGANEQLGRLGTGTTTYRDEPNDNADTVEVTKKKRKQVDAIESACRQIEVALGGPRLSFSTVYGSAAFLAILLLLWPTRLPGWSVILCSVTAGISVFFLAYQFSTRPHEWGELIGMLLAGYDPIDKEAYRCLQKDIGAKGYMDQWRVREWVGSERRAIRSAENREQLTGSEFLRKVV